MPAQSLCSTSACRSFSLSFPHSPVARLSSFKQYRPFRPPILCFRGRVSSLYPLVAFAYRSSSILVSHRFRRRCPFRCPACRIASSSSSCSPTSDSPFHPFSPHWNRLDGPSIVSLFHSDLYPSSLPHNPPPVTVPPLELSTTRPNNSPHKFDSNWSTIGSPSSDPYMVPNPASSVGYNTCRLCISRLFVIDIIVNKLVFFRQLSCQRDKSISIRLSPSHSQDRSNLFDIKDKRTRHIDFVLG
jgi:hypothetical protein